jgi:hypothetical protein
MRRAVLAGVLCALTLSACANYQAVEPKRHEIGDAYSVAPDRIWSRARQADHTLWTVDGPSLEALHMWADLQDGAALVDPPAGSGDTKDLPVYKSGMRAGDIADLVAASLTLQGGDARVRKLRPAKFGTLDGFRFAVDFETGDGLEKRALAKGAVSDDGRLHLIVYEAAAEHYFEVHRRSAEAVFASVETL